MHEFLALNAAFPQHVMKDRIVTTSITMPLVMREAVIDRAKKDDRSFSATVRRAVEQYVARNS